MSDKTKLDLIKQMIDNNYEFLSSSDDAKNSTALEVLIGSIYTILYYDGDEKEEGCGGCSCHGVSA